MPNPSTTEIANILRNAKTIAVVGLSDDPGRESFLVSKEMQRRGYRIIPVNPNVSEVLGEPSYASLRDIPPNLNVDIVNVFRRSDALPSVVAEAVETKAPVIWAQQGVSHPQAEAMAISHSKTIIMDLCIAVAHSLFIGTN